jgi:aminoglycoside phosphotransferase (APT) family kinase protein
LSAARPWEAAKEAQWLPKLAPHLPLALPVPLALWTGREVWVHGDLLPGNLLVLDGRLSAVIDFGGLNASDPACDLQPAWNVFAGDSRMRFRAELDVDEASWLRGRGWALYQAVSALAYYWDTNPGMIRQASHALAQVLADSD